MKWFSTSKDALERLDKLERRADDLEHAYKMLRLEWEEAYEKIANTLRKLGRRSELLQKEMDGGRPLSPAEEAMAGLRTPSPAYPGLSPAQKRLTEQILARRRQNTEKIASASSQTNGEE